MHRYTLPGDADRESTVARLWLAGAVGVWERDDDVVAWFPAPDHEVPPGGRWEEEPAHDWLAAWRADLEPVRVGRLTVTPSWLADGPADETVVIDAGMAFGTGHHATTRLCLAALQELDLPGARVLDVGTGTGVLAIAAAKLGAREVVALDTDEDAVTAARANAARNRVDVDVRHGDLASAVADGPFEVVVANLVTDVVVALADRLVAITAGTLVASGISRDRAGEVAAVLGAGATVRTEAEWAAVVVAAS